MKCKQCNQNIEKRDTFCSYCGSPVLKTHNKTKKFRSGVIAILLVIVLVVVMINPFDFLPFNILSRDSSEKDRNVIDFSVIASGKITVSNPSISGGGASLSILPEYISNTLRASIEKYPSNQVVEGILMDLYEVTLENSDDFYGFINITLPFDEKSIPKDQNAEETIVILHQDIETKEWEKPRFVIDNDHNRVSFITTHLSPICVSYVNQTTRKDPNSDLNIAGGSIDISTSNYTGPMPMSIIVPSSTVNANFGVFDLEVQTGVDNPKKLMDRILGYNEDRLFESLSIMDPDLEKLIVLNSEEDLANYGLGIMGITASGGEYSTYLANFGFGNQRWKDISTSFSNLGMMISAIQFVKNMVDGKALSSSAWNLFKGAIYYKGASAGGYMVAKLAGVAAGAAVAEFAAIGLIGMWTFEQVFMPIENVLDYTSGGGIYYHQRYISSMEDYLNQVDQRSENYWYKTALTIHEVALLTIEEGDDPMNQFRKIMDKEIENYCRQFFEAPRDTRLKVLIATNKGGLYGQPDYFHYYDQGVDSLQIKDYEEIIRTSPQYKIEEFGNLKDYNYEEFEREYTNNQNNFNTEGVITGPGSSTVYTYNFTDYISKQSNSEHALWYMDNWADNEALQKEIIELYKKKIYEEYVYTHLDTISEIEINKLWHKVTVEMDALVTRLNEVITIEFVDEEAEKSGRESLLVDYVLAPNIAEYDQWKTSVDKNGKAIIVCSVLEYLVNGNFETYNMYTRIEGSGDLSVAKPVAVYSVDISDNYCKVNLSAPMNVTLIADKYELFPEEPVFFTVKASKEYATAIWNIYQEDSLILSGTLLSGEDKFECMIEKLGDYMCEVRLFDEEGREMGMAQCNLKVIEFIPMNEVSTDSPIIGMYSYENKDKYFFGFTDENEWLGVRAEHILGEADVTGTYTFNEVTMEGWVDDGLGGFKIALDGDKLSVYLSTGEFFCNYYRVPKD